MEGHCSTGQSPQLAVVPVKEEGEEEEWETRKLLFLRILRSPRTKCSLCLF